MKKFISSGFMTVAFAAASFIPNITNAATFSSYLKVGSTGAEVTALQSWLVSTNFLTMPAGVSMGYFGGLTKTAVAAWQASVGLPATGYFGPMSVAKANASASVTPAPVSGVPGCAAGAMFSATTGASCATTPAPVAGCGAGALFNSMTGASCTSTPSAPVSATGEGTLDVKLAAIPTDNANITASVDVPVYGLEIKARQADMTVQRLDLKVADTIVGGSAENPGSFINMIKVWDGSTLLASVPVDLNTFTKDSNNVYYIRLTGFTFNVAKDATKVLTVSFSTSGSIDTNRQLVISGYNTQSLRGVDKTGLSTYYDISTATVAARTQTFKKPGASSMTLTSDSNLFRATNYRVQTANNGAQQVTMLTFNVKSETGASKITTVNASTTVSSGGTFPTTLYLYDGSTLISAKTVTSSAASTTFDSLSLNVPQDTTKTLTIKADFPSTTATGTAATSSITSVVYDQPNGNTATVATTVTGEGQNFYPVVAQFALTSATVSSSGITQTGSTTGLTVAFVIRETAVGGVITAPTSTAFTVKYSTSSSAVQTALSNPTITVTPNNNIADGGLATVTVSATLDSTVSGLQNGSNGTPTFYITQAIWTPVGGTAVAQTWGLQDYKVVSPYIFTK